MVIHSVTRRPLMDSAVFAGAVQERFGTDAARVGPPDDDTISFDVRPSGAPGYMVELVPEGWSVHTDGTEEQCAQVAAWVRSLLPADFPRVIAADDDWAWHVELVPGISADQVLTARIEHDEHWSDSELEGT